MNFNAPPCYYFLLSRLRILKNQCFYYKFLEDFCNSFEKLWLYTTPWMSFTTVTTVLDIWTNILLHILSLCYADIFSYFRIISFSEMSLCKCKICDEEVLHHLLKKHMKSKHSCNLTKSQYEYVRETYYR